MKGFSSNSVIGFGQNLAAKATAAGQVAVANFQSQSRTMSKWDKRIFGTLLAVAAMSSPASAQGSVDATMTQVKSTAFTVGQGLFAIFLVVALVKTAKKFMGGEPDAMTSLMWLLGGVLVFFGFAALKTTLTGGAKQTGTATLIGE